MRVVLFHIFFRVSIEKIVSVCFGCETMCDGLLLGSEAMLGCSHSKLAAMDLVSIATRTVTANFLIIAIGTHSHLLTDNIHIEHEYAEFYFHSRLI